MPRRTPLGFVRAARTAVALLRNQPKLEARIAALELTARVLGTYQTWNTVINQVSPPNANVLVSVVLPSRNRCPLLARAIKSVLMQSHTLLELIVVDDGSTDGTAQLLESIQDPRLIVISGSGDGAPVARNLGLSRATGSIIAFADDDNVMAPNWLNSVVSYLEQNPDTDCVYGALLRESEDSKSINVQFFTPFDRNQMRLRSRIDLGATAFRSGLDDLIFDPSLKAVQDWDLLIRVTANHRLDAIPALASLYTTSAPNRITRRPDTVESVKIVAARAAISEASVPHPPT